MPTITARATLDRPAQAVWAAVADYGRDPEWRAGVETMAPDPAGEVRLGTTTAEVLHVAGARSPSVPWTTVGARSPSC